MLEPTVGDTYTLTREFGVGPGAVPAGAQLEVVAVADPGTPGIGGDAENRVVLHYQEPSTVVNDEGIPSEGVALRVLSLSIADLTSLVENNDG